MTPYLLIALNSCIHVLYGTAYEFGLSEVLMFNISFPIERLVATTGKKDNKNDWVELIK